MEGRHSPSVFELIACDSLKDGLREALRYLLDHLHQVDGFRERFNLLKPDEILLLLDSLIEYNYLRTYKSTYAENLYNLVRLSGNGKQQEVFSVLPSLVCVTLVPYIRRKLDKYFEELNLKETRTADEIKRIRIYKLFTRSCSLVNLIYLLRFSAGKSAHHNPLNALLGITLAGQLVNNTNEPKNLQDWLSKTIADLMGRGLTIGSYLIQFLDHWSTHTNSAPLFSASLPIPEPPRKDQLAYTDARSSNICLICLHVRQNECALSNTGYVFCYNCLQRYVASNQSCPVTGQPTTVDNIVKLFTAPAPS